VSVGAVRMAAASACSMISLLVLAMPLQAQQAIPPAATPGGTQPRPAADTVNTERLGPFNVPRVPDRPLGAEEGPRVRVRRFDLLGAATQPDVPASAVDAVLAKAIAEQPVDGYTVNQLQVVADRVAEEYRSRGLILAQAVVPAQDVVGGVVNILVMEGALGNVRFEGQKKYSQKMLARPFEDLLARPVRREDIESALLSLTDYPGLSAFGVFQAGSRVGTTDLLVRTQREQRFQFDSTLDNQGSQYSGEYRANLGAVINNPFGRADRLHFFGLYAFDPDDSKAQGVYGGFDYRIPLFSPQNALQFGYSHNLFEVGRSLRQLDIAGTTDIADISFGRTFYKTRLGEFSMQTGIARKDASFEQQNAEVANDVLAVGNLGFQWSLIGLRSRGITQLSGNYAHGFGDLLGSMSAYDLQTGIRASRLGAGGSFDKLTFSLQRYQRITQNQALLLRASGQYSSDLLVSLEQFSIGGPDTVRAYPGAEFLADTGGFASLEWIINAPGFAARPAFGGRTWGQILQVSLFVDYATGKLNEVQAGEDDSVNLSGAGIGVQLNIPNRFFTRVDVAKPIGSLKPSNGRDPQYFFRLGLTL
jgi:hemolysin activation/secretion protein